MIAGSWADGFEPIELWARGNQPLGGPSLLYGLALKFTVENAEVSADGTPNRATGDAIDGVNNALTATPTVGAQWTVDAHQFGVLAQYDVYKADAQVSVPSDSGTLQGNFQRGARSSVLAFYEWHQPTLLVGGKLDWVKQWELRTRSQGVSATLPGYGFAHLAAYARWEFSPTTFALPAIDWYTRQLSGGGQEFEDWRWTLAVRQVF